MSDILVAIKRTKWERDLMRYVSPEAVRHLYQLQNDAFDKIFASHLRQLESLNLLREKLQNTVFAYREELPHLEYNRFRLIISLGGDNHFIHVSHMATDQLMLGLNSDLQTSVGALLAFDTETFLRKIGDDTSLQTTDFITEHWTRIDGELVYPDGRKLRIGPCTSELSIRSSFPDTMSRYIIRHNDFAWEEQKSSGMLLSCGAGSTGWYKNCFPAELRKEVVFPKDAPYFKLVAREVGQRKSSRYTSATIHENDVLEMISEMEGEISVDANPDRTFDFPPGCHARFYLSRDRLKVVRDIKSK